MVTQISLEQLQNMIAEAYAVDVNDTLYYVGFNDDGVPFTCDYWGQEEIVYDEDTVNGEITNNDVLEPLISFWI